MVSLTDATAISGAGAFNYVLSLTGAPTTTTNIIDPFINVDRLTESAFTMYPNPVLNMLTVETGTSEILKIRLLSITGQEVFAQSLSNQNSTYLTLLSFNRHFFAFYFNTYLFLTIFATDLKSFIKNTKGN